MQKFSQLAYTRPDIDALKRDILAYTAALGKASSAQETRRLLLEHKERMAEFATMRSIASIRNTVDTRDPFYEAEVTFFNSESPKLSLLLREANEALLASPFRKELEAEFGELYFRNIEVQKQFADQRIVEDLIEESRLMQQYSKVSAVASIQFRGEECNFYRLLKYMQSTDRETRKAAFEAWAELYARIAPELDAIYDQQVHLRDGMAKKLGFRTYTEMAYLQRRRYDYTAADVEQFHRQVRDIVTPACWELRKRQAERLGLDKLRYYDEALIFPEGNQEPIRPTDELVAKAQRMYREMSRETGEFFDTMVEYELFDLETKPGKRPGGYCSGLPAYKLPFIFSNFNGTSADVDVLTHEAGHAFESYTAQRVQPLGEMAMSTAEINEIHSMAMECFAYPWMELFFSDAGKYRYAHLMDSLEVIPYMVCVDEFQHRVYDHPDMTAMERRAVWHELERTYMPWRDYDGNEFLEQGGFWMQKQHIFLFPFYYIEYALAQICAFQFYNRMKRDQAQAWQDYYQFCRRGGSLGYFDLLASAGLDNPLKPGTVEKTLKGILPDLLD